MIGIDFLIYKANAESCNRDSTREMEKGRGVKLVTAHETITIVLAIHKIRRTVLCFERMGIRSVLILK